jgi:hypothetical protein
MSLFVVYVPDTGHVVGAVNAIGAAPPAVVDSRVDPGWLVGAELPLRVSLGVGEIAVLPLLARDLAVHAADDEPGVFADPLAFGVEQVQTQPPKPALVRLASWSTALEFANGGLSVEVPVADETQVTPVLALISEGQDTHVLAGEIAMGVKKVTLPVTVGSGPHGVLVLAAGWVGRLEKVEAS